jgi:hypothetical protein
MLRLSTTGFVSRGVRTELEKLLLFSELFSHSSLLIGDQAIAGLSEESNPQEPQLTKHAMQTSGCGC